MIIGVDGYAGVGKDTVADIFVRFGFTKISFADALRESVIYATGLTLDNFIDRDLKDKKFDEGYILTDEVLTKFCDFIGYSDKTEDTINQFAGTVLDSPRHILAFLATEIARHTLSQTIWIDKYDERRQGSKHVITPDCRFTNEREHIKSLEGKLFWVFRDGFEAPSDHISENDKWPLDKYNITIHNTDINTIGSELGLWWSMVGSKIR